MTELRTALTINGENFDSTMYYIAGYDSPMKSGPWYYEILMVEA